MIDLEQIGYFLFMEQQEQEQKRQEDTKHKEDNTMNEKELKAFELTDEDLDKVSGGNNPTTTPDCYKPVPWGAASPGFRKSTCSGCSYILKCLNSMTTISPL